VGFQALGEGELFLFKLHAPHHFVVGGGFFARALRLPLSLAWESFGEANGVQTLLDMRRRIARDRHEPEDQDWLSAESPEPEDTWFFAA
jgi:putative restriction endonuclease